MKLFSNIFIFISATFIFCSCKKYLDAKQDKKLVIPSTIADLQALLDDFPKINSSAPSAGECFSDDYYLTDVDYLSLTAEASRRMYTWEKSNLFDTYPNDWGICYDVVYHANVVLQEIQTMERNALNESAYDNVLGQALFLRGFILHQAVVLWAKAYDPATAATDPGIPLRLDPDFNIPSVRASVQAVYDQILSDLRASASLLPMAPVHVVRPSKAAAYGVLARVYLSMRDYDRAWAYADTSLQLYNKLLDYNTLIPSATFPFTPFNTEVTFENIIRIPGNLNPSRSKIDSVLYSQYASNDLRRTVFFTNNNNGSFSFKGSYDGSALFGGIATDEMYLTRAECYARHGNTSAALNDLNTLLIKRWKTGTFLPVTATGPEDAVVKILGERRKELLMRGLRWIDLKRLNKDGANINIVRFVNGQQYLLPAGDLRYQMPIPENVILRTGMAQNPR